MPELTNYLEDDWDDNALSGRTSPEKDVFYQYGDGGAGDLLKGVYRPLWTIESGTPSATNQELQLSDGSTTSQDVTTTSTIAVGAWSFDFQFATVPSSGESNCEFLSNLREDSWRVMVNNTGSYNIRRPGPVDVVSSSWGADTNLYTSKVTRDSYAGFELFLNGTSKGTGTDSYLPDPQKLGFGNGTDARFDVDNLLVK